MGYHAGKPIKCGLLLKSTAIHYFHIDHKPPCLPPRILHNHCFHFLFFSFLFYFRVLSRPKRNPRQWLCKIWGVNKMHYGLCENGEYKNHKISRGLGGTRDKFPYLGIFLPVFNVNLCYAANQQRKLVSGKQR